MNYSIFLYFYSLAVTYPVIRTLAVFISGPISYVIFPVFVIVFFATKAKQEFLSVFSLCIVTGFFAWFSARVLKELFKIARPFITHPEITPFTHIGGYSFPSEHASVFGALTILLFYFDVRAGILGLVIAVSVLLSRMIVGVHYPADVLVGFLLGAIIATLFIIFFKKYIFNF